VTVNNMTHENLLKETIQALKHEKLTGDDVHWVGSSDGKYRITWEEFEKIGDVKYWNDYGANSVVNDLVVVGKNWWLERGEYDGSEWWEFKRQPILMPAFKPFTRVIIVRYESTIEQLNEELEERVK